LDLFYTKVGDELYNFINGESVAIILLLIGLLGLITKRNIIKTVLSLSIMQLAMILFFVTIYYSEKKTPPMGDTYHLEVVNPASHALLITAIVIGVSVTALALVVFIRLYRRYGTTNWVKVVNKRREDA